MESNYFRLSKQAISSYRNLGNLIACLILIGFWTSCKESDLDQAMEPSDDQAIGFRTRVTNDTLDYFAKAVAKAQDDSDIRSFLKQAAINNQWNDNCVVYAEYKDVVVKNSQTLATILYNNRDIADSRFGSNFFTNDVLINYPTISIYLYTGDEDLDLTDFNASTPKGVFEIPEDHTELDSILVYNWYAGTVSSPACLTTSHLDALAEPTSQYFCVGPNSLLDAYDTDSFHLFPGNLQLEIRNGFPPGCDDLFEAVINEAPITITITVNSVPIEVVLISHEDLLTIYCIACDGSSPINICGGEGGGGEDPCEEECDRDCRENRDQLVKYHFNYQSDLDGTCSWIRKWCRFTIFAVYATAPQAPYITNLLKTDRAKRRDLKGWHDRWWEPESDILFLTWDLDIHADPVKYSWVYVHPKNGKKVTFSIGFSGKFKIGEDEIGVSGSTSSEITKKDKPLYEDVNYYCDEADGEGHEQNTGSVEFYIKEQE